MLAFLLVILLLAAILDVYKGKIPNCLVITGGIVGLLRLCFLNGMWLIILHIPAVLIPLVILFPLYRIGTLGAGDVKLLSMIGCYFSLTETATCVFFSFLLGAILSMAILVKNKTITSRLTYLYEYLKESLLTKHFSYYYKNMDDKKEDGSLRKNSQLHFAIPIFLAALLHIGGIY